MENQRKVGKYEVIITVIATMLALLFLYAALSKLLDYDTSKREMLNQVFPRGISLILVWLVPVVELLIVQTLLFRSTRLMGMYFSSGLLILFSLYISITMSGAFGRIPCSCGGILKHMSYWTHLGFNVIFIVMAVLGIALEKQWNTVNRWFKFFNGRGGASKLSN
ncbi:MauE/DoxX family redox-associated membrane protein [Pedobacter psychroterrae]|uniref:Methylamine utilisation protein MauE domain-containing protein n=1 Tax=Pedobacter psychroterrae TaxID=2530453 RepID=A0A4R0NHD3_9SPHI|nr:MauE/DoxX family redox-associated membrane protein [Pedobacter psychroterrae]TCC99990.1 hypothetical protein EZ437_17275 [Pedobacter psychroterrae]